MLRNLMLLLAATFSLTLFAATARADQAAAEMEIKQRSAEFAATWNKHDAKALTEFWAEDGDLIDPEGVAAKGRAEVEKYFTDLFAGAFKNSTNDIAVDSVRLLGDDIAVVDWTATLSGVESDVMGGADGAIEKIEVDRDPGEGQPEDAIRLEGLKAEDITITQEPWKHHVVLVMQKQGGKWMFVVARPYSFQGK